MKAITEGDIQEEGIRTDAIFYCLAALQKFETMSVDDIQKIAFEIGLLGTKGIDMLDLKGWFYWTDFEDIPPDYLQN